MIGFCDMAGQGGLVAGVNQLPSAGCVTCRDDPASSARPGGVEGARNRGRWTLLAKRSNVYRI